MSYKPKNIAIVGIGGIGGYLGSKLAAQYSNSDNVDITFIQRGEHFNAINNKGLCYKTLKDKITHPDFIFDTPQNAGTFDVIFFTVKSKDLEIASLSLQHNMHKDTVLIPLLNGVNNEQRLQTIYPKHHVLNGCIYVSANIISPGIIQQKGGAGMIYFGTEREDTEQYIWIEKLLFDAGIKVQLTKSIQTEVWRKYIFIASLATITSYTGATIGDIVNDRQNKMQWICLMKELITLAKTEGVIFSDNIIDEYIDRARLIPAATKTSMQLDVETGKTSEFDIFVQFPIELSRKTGIHCTIYNEYFARLKSKLIS